MLTVYLSHLICSLDIGETMVTFLSIPLCVRSDTCLYVTMWKWTICIFLWAPKEMCLPGGGRITQPYVTPQSALSPLCMAVCGIKLLTFSRHNIKNNKTANKQKPLVMSGSSHPFYKSGWIEPTQSKQSPNQTIKVISKNALKVWHKRYTNVVFGSKNCIQLCWAQNIPFLYISAEPLPPQY